MSVITRSPNGTIRLYSKGADATMVQRLRAGSPASLLTATQDNLRNFSVQVRRLLTAVPVTFAWSLPFRNCFGSLGPPSCHFEPAAFEQQQLTKAACTLF